MIGPTKLCPQGIELVFVDLDNTILIDGAFVTPRVMGAIELARHHGCMVCVSSGRAIHMVPDYLRTPESMDYLLCANGASVHDTFGDVLFEQLMTKEQVLEAMDALKPLGAAWNAFVGDTSYFEWRGLSYLATGRLEPVTPMQTRGKLHTAAGLHTRGRALARTALRGYRFTKRLMGKREGLKQVMSVRPLIEQSTCGIAKVGCSLSSREATDRAQAILEHLGHFEVARVGAREMEITAAGATKGTAAAWLMDYLKVDCERAVAFGDSANDLPLAEVCGTFVAVGNSDEKVKQAAQDVCESADDDGVARWLERAVAEAGEASYV